MAWAKSVFEHREYMPFVLNVDAVGYSYQHKCARFWFATGADGRTIHWLVDEAGNSGKAQLCKFLVANCKACYMPNDCKSTASAWDPVQKIAVADVPRTERFEDYNGAAKLKDGLITQTKDEIVTKHTQGSPHVIVMSNYFPMPNQLTADRLHIIDLSQTTDATDITEIFPPARFPGVLHIWDNGGLLKPERLGKDQQQNLAVGQRAAVHRRLEAPQPRRRRARQAPLPLVHVQGRRLGPDPIVLAIQDDNLAPQMGRNERLAIKDQLLGGSNRVRSISAPPPTVATAAIAVPDRPLQSESPEHKFRKGKGKGSPPICSPQFEVVEHHKRTRSSSRIALGRPSAVISS
jgi:hypothetical protein